MKWIKLAQDWDKWWVPVNMIMNLQFSCICTTYLLSYSVSQPVNDSKQLALLGEQLSPPLSTPLYLSPQLAYYNEKQRLMN